MNLAMNLTCHIITEINDRRYYLVVDTIPCPTTPFHSLEKSIMPGAFTPNIFTVGTAQEGYSPSRLKAYPWLNRVRVSSSHHVQTNLSSVVARQRKQKK
jgi:hypothetical protein